ncbi:MAG TPA: hypothetical protein VHY79_03405 [Rhizomicrobium sp.]|jgi:hypothetical protein|nr:hypothetical protein [Rhizomicrobium sp.]
MGLWNSIVQNLRVDSWGVAPISLAAPFGLLVLMLMARRFVRERGPKAESGDIAGVAFLAIIIGVAFLWIIAGLGLIERSFR